MERESTGLNSVQDDADRWRWLTPDRKEQSWRILKGLCPHNQGWLYEGHGHNRNFYRCVMCGEMKDY